MTPRQGIPAELMFGPNVMQVRATSIVAYTHIGNEIRSKGAASLLRLLQPGKDKAYSGLLKDHARRRLRRACEILALCSPLRRVWNPVSGRNQQFKLAFVTLTLPVDLSARQEKDMYKQCLKPFLQYLTRACNVQSYVWKLEATKSGRPHYHIAINEFVHYQHVRNGWNRVLRKAGYLDQYASVHGHYNAPSTEIKAVKDVTKAAQYLSKYVSKKGSDERRFEGKLWDCSVALKGMRWPVYEVAASLLWKIVDCVGGKERIVCGDERFVMLDVDLSEVMLDSVGWIRDSFARWKCEVGSLLYQGSLGL